MQEGTILERKFARYSQNILIFVILGILIIPVMLSLATPLNEKIISHKISTKNNNFFAYQRLKVVSLPQGLIFYSKTSSNSKYENDGSKSDHKKITVYLSLDEHIVNSLRNDAKVKGLSLNARINGILGKYINCYQRAEDYESCIIPSRQFSGFLEMLDEARTAEIMKYDGINDVLSFFRHRNIPITLESIIKFAFENIAVSTGACYKFSQHIDDGSRTLVFDHRYGMKWSRIISNVFSSMLQETCNVHTSVNILPNSVLIKILEKDI
jgi:hypothetical protein